MSDYINGIMPPRFVIRSKVNPLIDYITVDFPLCNVKGQIEEIEPVETSHELENGIIENETKGYRLYFTLNFEELITKDNLLKIGLLYRFNGNIYHDIFLYPNRDVTHRIYKVVVMPDKLLYKLVRQDSRAEGMEGVIIKFMTKELITDPFGDWVDIDNIFKPFNLID